MVHWLTAEDAREQGSPAARAGGVPELATAAKRLGYAASLEEVGTVATVCAKEVLAAQHAALLRIEQRTCRVLAVAPGPRDTREIDMSRAEFRAEDRPALNSLIRDRLPWVASAYDEDGTLLPPGDPRAGDEVEVETLIALGAAAAMAVPVEVNGTVWGEVYITRNAPGERFGPTELAAATVLAGLVGGAVARVDLEAQVRHLVADDPLTGLVNRRIADAAAEHALASGGETCIVMCDVDGLKRVNDELGHDAGDDLLRAVADVLRRISEALPGATAARLGGDEFCVITSGHPLATVREVTARTVDTFPLPHAATLSFGISSTAIAGAVPASQLFRRADQAQYRAKRAHARQRAAAGPVTADPAVTAERLVVSVSAALADVRGGPVARLCALAAAAADTLGAGEWAVLRRRDDDEQADTVARGGDDGSRGEHVRLEAAYGTWLIEVSASATAAIAEPVPTTLGALTALAVVGAA